MSNAFESGLLIANVSDAIMGTAQEILPQAMKRVTFAASQDPIESGASISVPFYNVTSASTTWSGSFSATDINADAKSVTILYKYRSWIVNSVEAMQSNALSHMQEYARINTKKLLTDVVTDIFSLFTQDNFSAISPYVSTAIASWDYTDLVELAQKAFENKIQEPVLLAKPALYAALAKDKNYAAPLQLGAKPWGMEVEQTNLLPSGTQTDGGVCAGKNAIVAGFGLWKPIGANVEFNVVTEPATGIPICLRSWSDPDYDGIRYAITVAYGKAVGDSAQAIVVDDNEETSSS